jgi:hypothetical protein
MQEREEFPARGRVPDLHREVIRCADQAVAVGAEREAGDNPYVPLELMSERVKSCPEIPFETAQVRVIRVLWSLLGAGAAEGQRDSRAGFGVPLSHRPLNQRE